MDEGYRLMPGLSLLRGQVLFRDVWAGYPPLSYYLHRLAFEALGVEFRTGVSLGEGRGLEDLLG